MCDVFSGFEKLPRSGSINDNREDLQFGNNSGGHSLAQRRKITNKRKEKMGVNSSSWFRADASFVACVSKFKRKNCYSFICSFCTGQRDTEAVTSGRTLESCFKQNGISQYSSTPYVMEVEVM